MATDQMVSHFDRLPVEVLELLGSFLNDNDLASLKSTYTTLRTGLQRLFEQRRKSMQIWSGAYLFAFEIVQILRVVERNEWCDLNLQVGSLSLTQLLLDLENRTTSEQQVLWTPTPISINETEP